MTEPARERARNVHDPAHRGDAADDTSELCGRARAGRSRRARRTSSWSRTVNSVARGGGGSYRAADEAGGGGTSGRPSRARDGTYKKKNEKEVRREATLAEGGRGLRAG